MGYTWEKFDGLMKRIVDIWEKIFVVFVVVERIGLKELYVYKNNGRFGTVIQASLLYNNHFLVVRLMVSLAKHTGE